jgi:DNA ligase (NAD+)
MYSSEEQKELIDLTAALLKDLKSDRHSGEKELAMIEDLRKSIRYHDWRYYVTSEAVIADFEYDLLLAGLKKLEEKHPETFSEDSPTERVALGITKEFPEVQHPGAYAVAR